MKSNRYSKTYEGPSDVPGYVRYLIRRQVCRLVPHGAHHDREDLAQELALHAHVAAASYDPSRGAATTYFDRVLSRRAITLTIARRAKCRDRRRERPVGLAATRTTSAWQTIDLHLDVAEALDQAPTPLRSLAGRFMDGETEADAGRSLSLTRAQVRHRRSLLRDALAAVGLAPDAQSGEAAA